MNCEICQLPYNLDNRYPLSLPCCNESVCKECLQNSAKDQTEETFPCPLQKCAQPIPLNTTFKVNRSMEKVLRQQNEVYMMQVHNLLNSIGIFCNYHSGQVTDYFCQDHSQLICTQCALTTHSNHQLVKLTKQDVVNYNNVILEKLSIENDRIYTLISEIKSYQKNKKQFTAQQYQTIILNAQHTLLYKIQTQDELNQIKFLSQFNKQEEQVDQLLKMKQEIHQLSFLSNKKKSKGSYSTIIWILLFLQLISVTFNGYFYFTSQQQNHPNVCTTGLVNLNSDDLIRSTNYQQSSNNENLNTDQHTQEDHNYKEIQQGDLLQIMGKSSLIESHQDKYLIKYWLGNKSQTRLELLYKGTRDGFTAVDFHSRCDGQGPTITVVQSISGHLFGGYTEVSWNSTDKLESIKDYNAFLFSLTFKQKMNQKAYYEQSVRHYKDFLVAFGGGMDLKIDSNCDQQDICYANLGKSYNLPNGIRFNTEESFNYMAGSLYFKIKEIEVYRVIK